MAHPNIHSVQSAIEDIRAGKIIIVVDDEDRENEGDFLMAAGMVSTEAVNFMVTHGRGLVCAPITAERARALDLGYMVSVGADPDEAAFTISVDLKAGTTTGISASDRAATIKALIDPQAKPLDFRRPGHIFPLIGVDGGVLRRPGHTEAAIDLARLAGCEPAGVICEIMSENGEMARFPELVRLAERFDMKIITIRDLIRHRLDHESLIRKTSTRPFPTLYGDFELSVFEEVLTGDLHIALHKGHWDEQDPVLVRVHSANLLADTFGAVLDEQAGVLSESMRRIQEKGAGIVLYMNQMNRDNALAHRLNEMQAASAGAGAAKGSTAADTGSIDTLQTSLPVKDESVNDGHSRERLRREVRDTKDYGIGAQILYSLGVRKINLLTNHPVKRIGIDSFGLEIVETLPVSVTEADRVGR